MNIDVTIGGKLVFRYEMPDDATDAMVAACVWGAGQELARGSATYAGIAATGTEANATIVTASQPGPGEPLAW